MFIAKEVSIAFNTDKILCSNSYVLVNTGSIRSTKVSVKKSLCFEERCSEKN